MGKEISQGVQRGRKESEQVLKDGRAFVQSSQPFDRIDDMEEVEKMTPRAT